MARMKFSLILLIMIGGVLVIAAPLSSQRPRINQDNDSEDTELDQPEDDDAGDEADDVDRTLLALDYDTKSNLALILSQDRSRDQMRALLQRTIDLLDHRSLPDRSRRHETHNSTAKALGRLLSGDPNFGSTSGDSCFPSQSSGRADVDFCAEDSRDPKSMSIAAMKKIIELKEKGKSNKAIKKLYPRYKSDRIPFYRRCVNQGESTTRRIQLVNEGVLERFDEARAAGRTVHGYNIRRWGLELADELNLPRSYFMGGHTWLFKLKKSGGIGSRKITELYSRRQETQQDVIDHRIDQFLSDYDRRQIAYRPSRIINMDQTPFNYEPTNKRTLSYIGERDTRCRVDQMNKATHSFTSQPMITRDGRVFGKLLLVMQEPTGSFGRNILPRVREQERMYRNIRVFASKSGKLSSSLIRDWMIEVLHPAMRGTLGSLDTDTDIDSDLETMSILDDAFEDLQNLTSSSTVEYNVHCNSSRTASPTDDRGLARCYRNPHSLLIADSWAGQSNAEAVRLLRRLGVEFLQIPPLTTRYIQPLDVYFNLQYKKFINRIFEESADPRSGVAREYLSSRAGIINTHSLVWNQFGSENYTDMLRFAWHNTDPDFSVDELTRPLPVRGVIDIQFNLNETRCQHKEATSNSTCSRPAFIRCSYCGKVMCLKHFIDRACFHEIETERAGPSGEHTHRTTPDSLDDDYDDFDPEMFRRLADRSTSTTTTSTSTTMRPYGSPGTYSVDTIERQWLGPRKRLV